MSFKATAWAADVEMDFGRATVTARLILMSLASVANECGHCVVPIRQLSTRANSAERTVQRALRRLTTSQLLRIITRIAQDGDPDSHVYEIPSPDRTFVSECPYCRALVDAVKSGRGVVTDTTGGGVMMSPPGDRYDGGWCHDVTTHGPTQGVSASDITPDANGDVFGVQESLFPTAPSLPPLRLPSFPARSRVFRSSSSESSKVLEREELRDKFAAPDDFRNEPAWSKILRERLVIFAKHPLTPTEINDLSQDFAEVAWDVEIPKFVDYWRPRRGPTMRGRLTALRNWLLRAPVARNSEPDQVSEMDRYRKAYAAYLPKQSVGGTVDGSA